MHRTALHIAIIATSGALVLALTIGAQSQADSARDARARTSKGQRPQAARVSQPKDAPFAVHEWGTFTSMQGSTGVELDGMQHEGESLPEFVHSFTKALPSPFQALGNHSRNPRVRRTRSKMETPVIYFHSDRPMDVRVTVHFVRGLMSHYFPAPTNMIPEVPEGGFPGPIDLASIGGSMLQWQAHIEPDASPRDIPPATGNHYATARAVDAAKVRVTGPSGTTESERFLFYRGLGLDNPAIHITAQPAGRAQLHNAESEGMPAAFAIEMQAERGRFVPLGEIAAGGDTSFDLGRAAFASKQQTIAALSEQVFAALCAQGLHADEARAMVDTWAGQWFGSLGTRVVYVVPTAYVSRILPLSIEPAPDKLVRVFVGRIEYLTPEEELRIEDDLRASGSLDRSVREAAMARLAAEGRFMEPKIRRVRQLTGDQVVRDRAKALLSTIEKAGE